MASVAFPELIESFVSSKTRHHYSEATGYFSTSFPPRKKKWDSILSSGPAVRAGRERLLRQVCKTHRSPRLGLDVLMPPYFLNAFQLQGSFVQSFCHVNICFAPELLSGDCLVWANCLG